MTTKFPMLDARVALRVDFIHLGTTSTRFVASLLEQYLQENELASIFPKNRVCESTLLSPILPTADRWTLTEDSDINDAWGRGLQIQTHLMPWLTHSSVDVVRLLQFVRENGVTDKSCRMTFTASMVGLKDINRLELLFLLNEQKNIAAWSRMDKYAVKSHMEQAAAELHTNLYWHGNIANWLKDAHKKMSYDRGYTVDFGRLESNGLLDFSFVQGPHYEHQENEVLRTLWECMGACRDAVTGHPDARMTFMNESHNFWKTHTAQKHPAARFRDPA